MALRDIESRNRFEEGSRVNLAFDGLKCCIELIDNHG